MRKITLLLLVAGLAACGSKNETVIKIGSKAFTEQFILGELMAQMIEAKTDLTVKRIFNLGGTMICHTALVKGDIDLYADYTGTALTVVLKKKVISDPQKAYEAVAKDYWDQFQLEWLSPFGFNNTYVLAVRGEDAEKNGWKTISDIRAAAGGLKIGFPAEFALRPDGYPGLKKTYGLRFASTHDMDPGLMYQAVLKKDVDVIPAFSTDARIVTYKLRLLRDDKGFFPPYYAAPIVRAETLKKNPSIRAALAPLAGLLSDKTMQELNYQADEKKRSPAEIAKEFLTEKGLLE